MERGGWWIFFWDVDVSYSCCVGLVPAIYRGPRNLPRPPVMGFCSLARVASLVPSC